MWKILVAQVSIKPSLLYTYVYIRSPTWRYVKSADAEYLLLWANGVVHRVLFVSTIAIQ